MAFGEFSAFSMNGEYNKKRKLQIVDQSDKDYRFNTGESGAYENSIDDDASTCYVSRKRRRVSREWMVYYLESPMAVTSFKFENAYYDGAGDGVGNKYVCGKVSHDYGVPWYYKKGRIDRVQRIKVSIGSTQNGPWHTATDWTDVEWVPKVINVAITGSPDVRPAIGWVAVGGVFFIKYFGDKLSWDEAEEFCSRLDATGHLVAIGSQAEQDAVEAMALQADSQPWIGLKYNPTESVDEDRDPSAYCSSDVTSWAWASTGTSRGIGSSTEFSAWSSRSTTGLVGPRCDRQSTKPVAAYLFKSNKAKWNRYWLNDLRSIRRPFVCSKLGM
jgi:hypothetical protein